jgi:hypothetical protein
MMTAKDWKIACIEGAVKNGPWFCLYAILTISMGYGFVEFGRIAGESVKSYIAQAKQDNATTLEAVKLNGQQIKQALCIMVEAKDMMEDVPEERRRQTALLQEMVEGQRATAEELRAFRKNLPAPPMSNDGGA